MNRTIRAMISMKQGAYLWYCQNVLGLPAGWSICGYVGACAAVTPALRPLALLLDWVFCDTGHCEKSVTKCQKREADMETGV